MAAQKKQKGILLLDKNKLDFFVVSLPSVVSFPFQPAAVRNIELIDKNLLAGQLHTFLQTNKIPPASFTIILHESILFEKFFSTQTPVSSNQAPLPHQHTPATSEIKQPTTNEQQPIKPSLPPITAQPGESGNKAESTGIAKPTAPNADEIEKSIQHFIDSIPFEEVAVSRTKTPQGIRVVGTNKQLITALKTIFETEGHSIDSVYPATFFPKEVNISNGLTPETGNTLLMKTDALRNQTMSVDEPKPPAVSPLSSPLAMPQKESEKKRLILMGGIFIILIGVMIVLFMRMNAENAKYAKKPPVKNPQVTMPTATPPVASVSAITKDAITIQISGTAAKTTKAQQVLQNLQNSGFTKVTILKSTVSANKTLISVTPDIPVDLRNLISGAVSSVSAQFAIQESSASALPRVNITL